MRELYDLLAAGERTLFVHGSQTPRRSVRDLLAGLGVTVETVDADLRVRPGLAVLCVDGTPRDRTTLDELAAYVDDEFDETSEVARGGPGEGVGVAPETSRGHDRTRPAVLGAVSPSRTSVRAASKSSLLAVSRHLESLALRAGTGRLVAGFQTLSTYTADGETRAIYRRIADRGVDVTVCGRPDVDAMLDPDVRVYEDTEGRFEDYWFLLVDGGRDARKGVLVARETDPGRFTGWWTRRAATVDAAFETARATCPALFGRD